LDTEGNIFGGFTPVEWESRVWNGMYDNDDNCRKADDSLRSFVFTLKNPHNIPARRFGLNAACKQKALRCDSQWGPFFGDDIMIVDQCNASTESYTFLDYSYTNDTRLEADVVFTGSQCFKVREIEVFEITD
jgi:hypothetical protein